MKPRLRGDGWGSDANLPCSGCSNVCKNALFAFPPGLLSREL